MEFEILEQEFAKYNNVNGCVAVNTGTAALHVALEALQLPPNSEVIIPQYTMIATAWAVYYSRLTPRFVDCETDLLININQIENEINSNTKVIMITHVYGRVVNMDAIMKIANKYNLRVIEDAAEAHGCMWNNKKVGSYDIGCFSFYRNKIIHGEEGGAVISNDLDYLNIVKDMKSMSFGTKHDYSHQTIGFNYRMTNSQAQLILNSLYNVDTNIKIRRENQKIYNSMIDPIYHMPDCDVPWVYDIHVPNNNIVRKLNSLGIAARYGFKPVSISSPFNSNINTTNSLKLSKHIMYLPVGPNENISYNINMLNKILHENNL